MIVRCKFRCTSVAKHVAWSDRTRFLYDAKFSVVTSGSDENKSFFEATPNGELTVGTYKEDHFIPGKEYYIDISPADAGE